ncbi:hypothetical protein HDU76_004534, partial [Blyttiomyces sp. JEL0837]
MAPKKNNSAGWRPVSVTSSVEDLILLPKPVGDESIVSTLKERYAQGQIFTRVGSSTMVVVNPVHNVATTSDETSRQYAEWAQDTSSDKVPLPAHVFDFAASVFYHMLREQQDQSIIISGESGSGKSEVRKMVVRQLCALSKSAKKKSKVISGVLKTETIMEAFGCASTVDNPNSSRFGQYVEYQYDEEGKLVGAKLLDYLLEKSRVVSMPDDGRNFNVFYYLLAGATIEERQSLRLTDPSQYQYLSHSKYSRTTLADAEKLTNLREHLKSVGVGRRQQAALFETLAAIMHLGNI